MEDFVERSMSLRDMYPTLASVFEGEPTKSSYANMYEFINDMKDIHDFSLQYGLLLPNIAGVEVSQAKTSWKLLAWNRFLQLLFVIGTIIIFIMGIWGLAKDGHDNDMKYVFICFYLGITVQNCLVIPAVITWNRELLKPRRIPRNLYMFSFKQAKEVGDIIFIVFTAFTVLLGVMCLVAFSTSPTYAAISAIIVATGFFPINFTLTGLVVFYIMEQRATYQVVSTLRLKAENAELTCREYLSVKNDIQEKDRQLAPSLGWLLSGALWNTIIGIAIISALNSFLTHAQLLKQTYMIIFSIVYFGKQTGLLVLLLEEIGTINDLCSYALQSLAERDFSLIYNMDQKVQDEREMQRIKLCIALRECPVSVTIGGWRFSKAQLRIQMCGALLSYVVAILRTIILSSLDEKA